ncbi:FAD-dependent monooxygenase, partial [Solirubrobacter phytolaccae]
MRLPRAVDVLIVGAGPVGSALAIELGVRGVRPLVVERRATLPPPTDVRARNLSIRTMEAARRWGVAEALRAARPLPPGWHRGMLAVTRVAGHELLPPVGAGRELWAPSAPWATIGAEPPIDLPQYRFLRVVRERAAALGARFVLGVEVTDLRPDATGVTVRVGDDVVGARWLVACDGGRSRVREAVGIDRELTTPVGHLRNLTFRLPGAFGRLGVRPGVQFRVINHDAAGLTHPYERDRWRIAAGPLVALDELDVHAEIARFLGRAGLPVTEAAVTTHTIQRRTAWVYRAGRVLLAGDAASAFPPHLGQNLNHGVADAVTLGWMLPALLAGWGGEALLDAYEHERRAASVATGEATLRVAEAWLRVGAQARALGPRLDDPGGRDARDALAEHVAPLLHGSADGVLYDQRHPTSPLALPAGEPGPDFDPAHVRPSTAPGHRAPHVWLAQKGLAEGGPGEDGAGGRGEDGAGGRGEGGGGRGGGG